MVEANGPYAWRFRPTREDRGLGKSFYAIDLIGDCSLDPAEMNVIIGKQAFLLLAGGSDHFESSRCVNVLGGEIGAAIRGRIAKSCPPR